MQVRRAQVPALQSKPEGHEAAEVQVVGWQRLPVQVVPAAQGLFGPQPGAQSVWPPQPHARGSQISVAPQAESFAQVLGWGLQMPHPDGVPGGAHCPMPWHSLVAWQQIGDAQPSCGHWKGCAVTARHCLKSGAHEH